MAGVQGRGLGWGGSVEVWRCGGVEVWRCGGVEVWRCGGVEVWRSGKRGSALAGNAELLEDRGASLQPRDDKTPASRDTRALRGDASQTKPLTLSGSSGQMLS
jgi:hypothetical protein